MVLVSFMLFSMFFGAGNLIFPPFLGQNAGLQSVPAFIGFLITGVVLPILGVIVVAQADGLDQLAGRVGKYFSMIFTLLIYVSIGPGLGIPRAASVPFEMAVAPYLPAQSNFTLFMVVYSLVFFLIAGWLSLNPKKLVQRIGNFLTPSLLILLAVLFISFVFKGKMAVAPATKAYQQTPFLQGFVDGYQTMDTIAALNFGLVIATTLRAFGVEEKKSVVGYTVKTGAIAGSILAIVYVVLTIMGCFSSGVYPIQENGAWTLRNIVAQIFGEPGAILLATIFTLACLTTCVGLITSISQFFAGLFVKFSYRTYVLVITVFSFLVCNMGLTTILSFSVPVLNAIYPIAIMLIVLGLMDKHLNNNKYIYPCTITGVGIVSVMFALRGLKVSAPGVSALAEHIPLYKYGFGWVTVAVVMVLLSVILNLFRKRK